MEIIPFFKSKNSTQSQQAKIPIPDIFHPEAGYHYYFHTKSKHYTSFGLPTSKVLEKLDKAIEDASFSLALIDNKNSTSKFDNKIIVKLKENLQEVRKIVSEIPKSHENNPYYPYPWGIYYEIKDVIATEIFIPDFIQITDDDGTLKYLMRYKLKDDHVTFLSTLDYGAKTKLLKILKAFMTELSTYVNNENNEQSRKSLESSFENFSQIISEDYNAIPQHIAFFTYETFLKKISPYIMQLKNDAQGKLIADTLFEVLYKTENVKNPLRVLSDLLYRKLVNACERFLSTDTTFQTKGPIALSDMQGKIYLPLFGILDVLCSHHNPYARANLKGEELAETNAMRKAGQVHFEKRQTKIFTRSEIDTLLNTKLTADYSHLTVERISQLTGIPLKAKQSSTFATVSSSSLSSNGPMVEEIESDLATVLLEAANRYRGIFSLFKTHNAIANYLIETVNSLKDRKADNIQLKLQILSLAIFSSLKMRDSKEFINLLEPIISKYIGDSLNATLTDKFKDVINKITDKINQISPRQNVPAITYPELDWEQMVDNILQQQNAASTHSSELLALTH